VHHIRCSQLRALWKVQDCHHCVRKHLRRVSPFDFFYRIRSYDATSALTSLALSVMLHPPLTGRRVLLVILTILIAIPTIFVCIVSPHISMTQNNAFLVHLPYLVHPLLRFCTASAGSFGLVLSIALLLKPPAASWANVWDRLWVSNGVGWGSSQEKGLTAAWTFFTCLGIVEDWALRRWLGEDPDEVKQFLLFLLSLP
jgi:hypothetical protein